MSLSGLLAPLAICIECIIVIIGCYAGIILKKPTGFLFALAFLLFGMFDWFNTLGFSADLLAMINIVAVLAALGGMILFVKNR